MNQRCEGNFASSKGWAVSFLNFQISKAGIKNMELTWSPNLNVAHHTIGKERAALFRRYRVVARKRGPDVVRRVTRDNFRPVLSLQRDNGR